MLSTWKIESSSKRYANYPASAQSTHQSLDYDFIDSFLLLWCVFAEGNRSNVAPRFFTIQSNLLTPLQPLLENETTRVQFHEIKESPTNSSSVGKHRVLQRTYRIRIQRIALSLRSRYGFSFDTIINSASKGILKYAVYFQSIDVEIEDNLARSLVTSMLHNFQFISKYITVYLCSQFVYIFDSLISNNARNNLLHTCICIPIFCIWLLIAIYTIVYFHFLRSISCATDIPYAIPKTLINFYFSISDCHHNQIIQ